MCPNSVGAMLLISNKGVGSQQPEAKLAHTLTIKHLDVLDTHTQPCTHSQRDYNCTHTLIVGYRGGQAGESL